MYSNLLIGRLAWRRRRYGGPLVCVESDLLTMPHPQTRVDAGRPDVHLPMRAFRRSGPQRRGQPSPLCREPRLPRTPDLQARRPGHQCPPTGRRWPALLVFRWNQPERRGNRRSRCTRSLNRRRPRRAEPNNRPRPFDSLYSRLSRDSTNRSSSSHARTASAYGGAGLLTESESRT